MTGKTVTARKYLVELTGAELDALITAITFVDAGGGIDGELGHRANARTRVLQKARAARQSGA